MVMVLSVTNQSLCYVHNSVTHIVGIWFDCVMEKGSSYKGVKCTGQIDSDNVWL